MMTQILGKVRFFLPVALAVSLIILPVTALHSQDVPYDWRTDWEIEEGFSINIDTEGYQLPTAIAFVPNPGDSPEDPLYFVTELEGKIKVVTNDRTLSTFADLELDIPPFEEEAGMAGICLDAEHGYIFVTFASKDANKILRNNIVRFETQPSTFSLTPMSQQPVAQQVLSLYQTAGSHQIGGCQVNNELLYVSVADGGFTPLASQQIDSIFGKIIRMTLDGEPVSDNPFHQNADLQSAANYVWAYGLRNPFGLKIVDGQVFVADNGQALDRFVQIFKGKNYLWDGNDRSIASKADFVLIPSHGVVQLDYHPEDLAVFPEQYKQDFFLALAGGLTESADPGILVIEYDIENNDLLSVPRKFFRYTGEGRQGVVGLAFGPDGLYVVPILPNKAGTSAILKIAYDPDNQHPFALTSSSTDGDFLMYQKGCTSCHIIKGPFFGSGPGAGAKGPSLETETLVPRLQARLHSEEYIQSLEEIDQLDSEPFVSFKEARREVLETEGLNRVRTWIKYRIQEPRFDNLHSQMPNLGITEPEAIAITNALLEGHQQSALQRAKGLLLPDKVSRRHLVFYFMGGLIGGGITAGSLSLVLALLYYKGRK